MDQETTTLEIIAPTIDEAVHRGMAQLGVPRDSILVEVLDQGSHGFLGIGSRQARVRLKLIAKEKEAIEPIVELLNGGQETGLVEVKQVEGDEKALQVTRKIVQDLLQNMKVNAKVTVGYVQPTEAKGNPVILVQIHGDDLSILIGRRSETLNALQYLTSLIVGKQMGEWIPLTIDVQGYRSRRELQLRQIARRIAEQAVQTGRRQTLEPMPSSERRIIHMELHDHPHVTTESVGEEPNRKVTIVLKQQTKK
jgi:spoIIIJ-associated protein